MTQNPYAAPQTDGAPPPSPMSPERFKELESEINKLNRLSLSIGGAGLLLQIAGQATSNPLVSLLGTVLLIWGFTYYARMRGRSSWWGLLGLLSCIGLVALLVLPKRCVNCSAPVKQKTCDKCGAPAPK